MEDGASLEIIHSAFVSNEYTFHFRETMIVRRGLALVWYGSHYAIPIGFTRACLGASQMMRLRGMRHKYYLPDRLIVGVE